MTSSDQNRLACSGSAQPVQLLPQDLRKPTPVSLAQRCPGLRHGTQFVQDLVQRVAQAHVLRRLLGGPIGYLLLIGTILLSLDLPGDQVAPNAAGASDTAIARTAYGHGNMHYIEKVRAVIRQQQQQDDRDNAEIE